MRKRIFGRQFKRDRNERKALFKGLMSALVLHGRIQTTVEKAKAIQGTVEKLVTKGRLGAKVRSSFDIFLTREASDRMINVVAPVFAKRPGGYTRIIKTGTRMSDNASMAIIEWTEEVKEIKDQDSSSKKEITSKAEPKEKPAKVKKIVQKKPKK